MSFTSECISFITNNSCTNDEENEVIALLSKALPVSSSAIHWSRILKKEEFGKIQRDKLAIEINKIFTCMKLTPDEKLFIINIDDAFPAIRASLREWLYFIDELDLTNTIFLSENRKTVIHWDFYMELHATNI